MGSEKDDNTFRLMKSVMLINVEITKTIKFMILIGNTINNKIVLIIFLGFRFHLIFCFESKFYLSIVHIFF